MSSSGLTDHRILLDSSRNEYAAPATLQDGPLEARLILGERELLDCQAEIRQLRRRYGLEDDFTTDPEYFVAANTLGNRRCAAVLIRRRQELEACVLFYEHTRLGLGLGLFRGGDYIGESLVVGPDPLHVQYVHLATQELLKKWRVHGVSLTMKACASACVDLMGPASQHRRFSGTNIQHKLPLKSTYEEMLASLGPRTRRSLAGKRQQLEKSTQVKLVPEISPEQCLEVMLALEEKEMYQKVREYYHARYQLMRTHSDFYCMGLRLPDGTWLSMVSGWRRNRVTYVDLQMNDMSYKKESLSAVMRAFMLENEIGRKQEVINFVGGSSLLLRRYCEPQEANTDIFICKPGLLGRFFEWAATHAQMGSVYERVKPVTEAEGEAGPKLENGE